MATKSQNPKGRENAFSLLNAAIEVLTVAKEATSATPAQVAFSAAVVLLTMIKVSFVHFHNPGVFQVDTKPGFDAEPTGLRRTRIVLCRYL